MSTQTGIAVFGVGRWGVHLVRNFLEHPQAQVVAVVDPSAERLTALSERFELGDQVTLTSDWEAALRLPKVEAVAIATPATTHYTLIKTALKQGHHVLSEKPLTLSPTESLELCQLAEQQQQQLVVDHTYLFHPAVQRGKAVVKEELGDLRYGYAARTHLGPVRQDVDALWDLAIHDIAIFNTWLGETPTHVQAQGNVWLQPKPNLPHSNYFSQGLSDLVWAKLIYPSGFQAFIHLCWFNPDKQRRLAVVGSQGTLIFDELSQTPLTLQRGQLEQTGEQFTPINQTREVLSLEPAEPLQQVCNHFLTCVQQNIPSQVSSGWIGARLVNTLCALTNSLSQDGQVIKVSSSI